MRLGKKQIEMIEDILEAGADTLGDIFRAQILMEVRDGKINFTPYLYGIALIMSNMGHQFTFEIDSSKAYIREFNKLFLKINKEIIKGVNNGK